MSICGPPLDVFTNPESYKPHDHATKFWDVGQHLKYHFLNGTQNQQDVVKDAITTWLTHANLHLDYDNNSANADIRISFDSTGKSASWSAVGTDAKLTDKSKATMNLGWVADAMPPSRNDLLACLHELGHALGMTHERQSPARNGRIHLNEVAAYAYYLPMLQWNKNLVKSQVIDTYNLSMTSNYSQLDLRSIMMYAMPAGINQEDITSPKSLLSDEEKAFITLAYPNKAIKKGGMEVRTALTVSQVPDNVSPPQFLT